MLQKLQQRLEGIKENVPLAQFTTFRIGGPARYFYIAKNNEDIVKTVQVALELNIPYFILGAGSNILVSDKGFEGMVIKMQNAECRMKNDIVVAGAGVSNAILAKATVDAGLTGMEWAVGVPGTIGGSVRGNAGCFGSEMKNVVKVVKVLEVKGSTIHDLRYTNAQCEFKYRDSIFKHNKNLIILEVELKLQKGDQAEGDQKIKEILKKRSASQPKGLSSGCIFKNTDLHGGLRTYTDLPEEFIKRGQVPTGWIVEQCGLKGKKIGGAQISLEHGNFIINTGNATAEDVIILISLIKEKARNHFGIQLEEEIQLVGF